eukprot:TRINITY_DN462_c1_g4_i2.p1 TRINITY_DN462_c1_g4~~TRINITY_DN462_c1_g4_i2.p1  ORF type:complete len:286 (+),score=60.27 TRINITY_DN462_c1_g4_i2:57-860(+)
MRFQHDLERYVQWDVLIAIPVVYLLLLWVLKMFMKNRPAMTNLKKPMLVYNWVQVMCSGVMTYQLSKLITLPNLFCLGHDFTAHAELWVFAHFLSKILDMFDTIFIVLRKNDKQFTFLHVYHHATIGVIWGWLLQNGYGGGTGFYGAWINSFVHTVMYFHYGWVALGFQNPYKKYVTTLQISQFYSCLLHAVFVCLWDTEHFPMRICSLQLMYHCTMIALFTGFFKDTYKKGAASLPAPDVTTMEVNKQSELRKRSNPLPKIPGIEE